MVDESGTTNTEVARKVRTFFEAKQSRNYEKGQILIFPDENPSQIYYIKSGLVRQYDVSYRGDEIVVNVFKPDTFFPMSWAVANIPNEYFFQVAEDVEVIMAPHEEVLKFIKDNPDVLLDLLARVYKGANGMQRRMVQLMSGTAKSRLISELILEIHRFGSKQADGTHNLKISEVELGARAGLSRETVNRELRKLKQDKLVSHENGTIIIYDLDKLEEKLRGVV